MSLFTFPHYLGTLKRKYNQHTGVTQEISSLEINHIHKRIFRSTVSPENSTSSISLLMTDYLIPPFKTYS